MSNKELLLGVITNLESPQPQQWSESWINKLCQLSVDFETMEADNKRMQKALKKIIKAGDLWGSEGKQHHEAIFLARCALALIKHDDMETSAI